MTDDKIIKALEEYSERGITFCNVGMPEFARHILALIERQKAEIEALYEIQRCSDKEIGELNGELAKRRNLEESFSKTMREFDKRLAKTVKLERAEAIKAFAERLSRNTCRTGSGHDMVDMIFVNNLAREMTEEV